MALILEKTPSGYLPMDISAFDLFRDEGVWSFRREVVEHLDGNLSDTIDMLGYAEQMSGLCLMASYTRIIFSSSALSNRLLLFEGVQKRLSDDGAVYEDKDLNLSVSLSRRFLRSIGEKKTVDRRIFIGVYDVSLYANRPQLLSLFEEESYGSCDLSLSKASIR